jgi:hypothetical protein
MVTQMRSSAIEIRKVTFNKILLCWNVFTATFVRSEKCVFGNKLIKSYLHFKTESRPMKIKNLSVKLELRCTNIGQGLIMTSELLLTVTPRMERDPRLPTRVLKGPEISLVLMRHAIKVRKLHVLILKGSLLLGDRGSDDTPNWFSLVLMMSSRCGRKGGDIFFALSSSQSMVCR